MAALIESEACPMSPHDLVKISQRLADDVSRLVPDSNGYSVEDYFKLDGPYLVEYVEGCLQVLPLPSMFHQALVFVLRTILGDWLKRDPQARAVMSPFKVYVNQRVYREPDVAVMLGRNVHRRFEAYWQGADLVVEVISESNRQHDIATKVIEYAKAEIPEYWIIDPYLKTVGMYVLSSGAYQSVDSSVKVESRILPGLLVDVVELFERAAKEA